MTEEQPKDAVEVVEGEGSFDYLARSLAIVTLLYERGILQELLESGRITNDEIDLRLIAIRERYDFALKETGGGENKSS